MRGEVKSMKRIFLTVACVWLLAAGLAYAGQGNPFNNPGGSAIYPQSIWTASLSLDNNVEVLSANKTLVVTDLVVQKLDPNGSDRDVTLPAEASSTDLVFWIYNTANGAGEDLTIKDDGAATIVTLGPGMGMMFSCDGTTWLAMDNEGVTYDAQANTLTTTATLNLDTVDIDGNVSFTDGTDTSIIKHVQEPGLGGRITIGLDETARTMVIADAGDVDVDFGLGAASHPTLVVVDDSGANPLKISWNDIDQPTTQLAIDVYGLRVESDLYVRFLMYGDVASGNPYEFLSNASIGLTDTDGEQSWLYAEPKINQSGTAAYNGLHVNVLETTPGTSIGDGSTGQGNNLLLLERESVPYFKVDRLGNVEATSFTADASVTPSIAFTDSDTTDQDVSAQIYANATSTGTGAEIIDMVFQTQGAAGTAGTMETFMQWDASATSLILSGGTLHMTETTTPTAIADYGAIYPKADNNLYFQDGAGTEKLIETGSSDYGEMGNIYGSSATEALGDTNLHAMYHANITGSAPHLNSGFSFVAGKAGPIASSNTDAGSTVTFTDVAHGLLVGDIITLNTMSDASYDGVYEVQSKTDDTFTINETNTTASETGTWQMGSYLLIATAGQYRGVWNASFSQSLNNTQTSVISPYVNTTQSTKAVAARLLANNTDVGSIGGNGLMNFSAGDRIWFGVTTTAAQTLTFTIRNVTIH